MGQREREWYALYSKSHFEKGGKKKKGKKEKNETQKYLLNKGGRSINLPGFFARIPLFSSET